MAEGDECIWAALYTSQLYRNKKVKSFQDGIVKFIEKPPKILLFDEKGNKIDGMMSKTIRPEPDGIIEFDRHYCVLSAPSCQNTVAVKTPVTTLPNASRRGVLHTYGVKERVESNATIEATGRDDFQQSGHRTYSASTRTNDTSLSISDSAKVSKSQPSMFEEDTGHSKPVSSQRFRGFSVPKMSAKKKEDVLKAEKPPKPRMEPLDGNVQTSVFEDEAVSSKSVSSHRFRGFSIPRMTKKRKEGMVMLLRFTSHRFVLNVIVVDNDLQAVGLLEKNMDAVEEEEERLPQNPEKRPRFKPPSILPKTKSMNYNNIDQDGTSDPSNPPSSSSEANPKRAVLQRFKPFKKMTIDDTPLDFESIISRGLTFPSSSAPMQVIKNGQTRRLKIPIRFKTADNYRAAFVAAIYESLQAQIYALASQIYSITNNDTNPKTSIQNKLRRRGIILYEATLVRQKSFGSGDGGIYLSFSDSDRKSSFLKDDLWVVSKSHHFRDNFFCRSVFYGMSSAKMLEVRPFLKKDATILSEHFCSKSSTNVVALKITNTMSEVLQELTLDTLLDETPLVPFIVEGLSCKFQHSLDSTFCEILMTEAKEAIEEFKLNEDQCRIVTEFLRSFNGGSFPITLAHGVFGSGKSFLVCVIVVIIGRAKVRMPDKDDDEPLRVIISSNTNVAVDRILLVSPFPSFLRVLIGLKGLLKMGFEDFVRVGNVKKIAKPILPYTAQQKRNESDEMKELQSLLNENGLEPGERAAIAEALRRFKSNENKHLASTALVIGVTCLSTPSEILENITGTILILDECSQMTEPLSLLPITKFKTRFALLIGDPKQLSPTLPSDSLYPLFSLDRTLFERLAQLGITPTLLRTQYRCHPKIGNLANELFYDRKLRNGTSGEELEAVVEGGAPIVFIDVGEGKESFDGGGGSLFNLEEAEIVVRVVGGLLERDVGVGDIGVITFYRKQSEVISQLLAARLQIKGVQVSTVDAFQGAEKMIIILSTLIRHLIIAGNRKNLAKHSTWRKIIEKHADTRSDAFLCVSKKNVQNRAPLPSTPDYTKDIVTPLYLHTGIETPAIPIIDDDLFSPDDDGEARMDLMEPDIIADEMSEAAVPFNPPAFIAVEEEVKLGMRRRRIGVDALDKPPFSFRGLKSLTGLDNRFFDKEELGDSTFSHRLAKETDDVSQDDYTGDLFEDEGLDGLFSILDEPRVVPVPAESMMTPVPCKVVAGIAAPMVTDTTTTTGKSEWECFMEEAEAMSFD
ncbi:hypothetical protein HDU67_003970 [Dinochytrium kinnereticum]|nr:hypothetical protein HDU67_003970 [Dinochytrium kinnereticum]